MQIETHPQGPQNKITATHMQIETHPWCPQNKITATRMQIETHPWCPQNKATATHMQFETHTWRPQKNNMLYSTFQKHNSGYVLSENVQVFCIDLYLRQSYCLHSLCRSGKQQMV